MDVFQYSSTDSELKLWNVESGQCVRTYKGHTNEKNFVGLTVNKNFIACGKWRGSPLYAWHEDTVEDQISRDRYTMDWSHSEYYGSLPQRLDYAVIIMRSLYWNFGWSSSHYQ